MNLPHITTRNGKLRIDAATASKRRKTPAFVLTSVDEHQDIATRQRLISNATDLQCNFELAGWGLRKHLDYVSTFEFQSRTPDRGYNAYVEDAVRQWSAPSNFSVSGVFGRSEWSRRIEGAKTLSGDVFTHILSSGLLQAVEADRVKDPADKKIDELWVQGVKVTPSGAPREYAIYKRNRSSLVFEKRLPARYVWHHAYRPEGRFDAVRGLSLFAPAINRLLDLYESFDYALAKAKMAQLMGIAVFDDAQIDRDPKTNTDGTQQKITDGPTQWNLSTDAKLEMIESHSPAGEQTAYWDRMAGLCLKCLDIPYSFFDEAYTNYSGARQALILYNDSAEIKRQRNRDDLSRWFLWRAAVENLAGNFNLPPEGLAGLRHEWMGRALPWINPLVEINAMKEAVALGVLSRKRVARMLGFGDWEEINEELLQEKAVAAAEQNAAERLAMGV